MYLAVVLLAGCLEKTEVTPPVITLSQGEDELLYFSTIQRATVDVHIESAADLVKFNTVTSPMSSWKDTTIVFDPYTHTADIKLSYKLSEGYTSRIPNDSLFSIKYVVSTEDTSCSVFRKLRYKFEYPEIDSFDVTLTSNIAQGDCLLDVDNRCTYKYTEYKNKNFDLVYVNELRESFFKFGTALASPDAPYLYEYFADKCPEYPYDPYEGLPHRQTICGAIVDPTLTWKDVTKGLVGKASDWQFPMWLNYSDSYGFGYGVTNLQQTTLFKFRLQNGRYIMIRVLSVEDRIYPTSVVNLRVYCQK